MREGEALHGRTALVTGGAGFIGAHVVRRLLAEGARVRVLDSLAHGARRLEGLDVDVRQVTLGEHDPAVLASALEGVELLFHFAAEKHPAGRHAPARVLRANVLGMHALLEEAAAAGVRRAVFASSLYACGRTSAPPMRESECPQPATVYGISKLAGERLLAHFAARLPAVALRFFFVYGPGQEEGLGYPSVIVKTFRALRAGQPPAVCGDGEQALDYVYVEDAVEAALLALEAPAGSLFNVGTGRAVRVRALLATMSEIAGSRADPVPLPADETHGTFRVADTQAAERGLGFRARVPLEDGLRRTWEWLSRGEMP
ncbi:MAG TPA: NAD-dependent epimerase/dehydratase family protein [Vicinamibacteria bacterium]|jgi:UDP-glucose 4-epimerase